MHLPSPAPAVPLAPPPTVLARAPLRLVARPGATPLGAILGAVAAGTLLVVRAFAPERLGFTVCMLKAFTGVPCPTCGGTRALHHLAHLDLASAWAMNPLVTLGLLALVPWALGDLWLLRGGRALDIESAPRGGLVLAALLLAALLANWLYLLGAGR